MNKKRKGGSSNQKRVVQGKRTKNFEIVHRYIEKFFMKFDEVIRSFSLLLS